MNWPTWLLTLLGASLLWMESCASISSNSALSFKVDLKSDASCEEIFDIAMYSHPGIHAIEWSSPKGLVDDRLGCENRVLTINYSTAHFSEKILLNTMRPLVKNVQTLSNHVQTDN